MGRMPVLISLIVVLAAACASGARPAATPTTSPVRTPDRTPAGSWNGGTFRVETADLVVGYPDFLTPEEARTHADTLQRIYGVLRRVFALEDERLFRGEKTSIEFTPKYAGSASGNKIVLGRSVVDPMSKGYVNPPDPIFVHEMVHVFVNAQRAAGRYYVYQLVPGMNEALADYLKCWPKVLELWSQGAQSEAYCALTLHGTGAKGNYTLDQYEANGIDPYTLDWSAHPPARSAEAYFPQMLARVSEKAGWDVWRKFFQATTAGGNPGAREAFRLGSKSPKMTDPLIKKAFGELVDGLGNAGGQDLRPMFRNWGFDV